MPFALDSPRFHATKWGVAPQDGPRWRLRPGWGAKAGLRVAGGTKTLRPRVLQAASPTAGPESPQITSGVRSTTVPGSRGTSKPSAVASRRLGWLRGVSRLRFPPPPTPDAAERTDQPHAHQADDGGRGGDD